jgi:hypothetical protein
MVGGAIGAQVVATFLAAQLDRAGHPTASAYTLAFGLCAVTLAASVLVVFLVPRTRGRFADAAGAGEPVSVAAATPLLIVISD